ncbi:MAG TPA: hypothetical protein DCS97_15975 [Planctomycetes bacterium]|nr:hypothetical protein [Planctomycetota bacterium]
MRWCLLLLPLLLIAGEPVLPDEAKTALLAQAKTYGPLPSGPAVIAAWIWGGRADINYKSFFEWDVRLAAGAEARRALKARITTLGPSQEVLRQGTWEELGDLPAHEQQSYGLRLNCPTFGAWRLDLAWEGGSAAFVAGDKQSLPLALAGSAATPLLLAVNAQAEEDKKKKVLVVTWNLWNLGGAPAAGVVQTVKLKDESGKVVATSEVRLKGAMAPGSTVQRAQFSKPPTYTAIAVDVRHDDAGGGKKLVLEPPASGGPDLVISSLTVEGSTLTARVVNRLGKDLPPTVIDLVFTTGGKPTLNLAIPVAALANGGEAAPSIAIKPLPAWDEYSVGWSVAK